MIVREYLQIDHEKLLDIVSETYETIASFSQHISGYLVNELGVANTFSNEDGK